MIRAGIQNFFIYHQHKNKQTHIFFVFPSGFSLQSYSPFYTLPSQSQCSSQAAPLCQWRMFSYFGAEKISSCAIVAQEIKKKTKLKNRQFRQSPANYVVVGFYAALCIYTCTGRSVPVSNYQLYHAF